MMPYTAGTQGADANCAATFVATLKTALLAAGFEFVEDVGTTDVASVFKSPAATNTADLDWFLFVRRSTASSTTVSVTVAEQYNSATHLVTYYAPGTNSLTPAADGAVNDPAGKSPTAASTFGYQTVTVAATMFNYFFSITPNRIVIGTRVGANDTALYAGMFTDWYPLAAYTYPKILVCNLDCATQNAQGRFTREPNVTTSATNHFKVYSATPLIRSPAGTPYLSGAAPLSELVVAATPAAVSTDRGMLLGVWGTGLKGVNGDTITANISGASKTLAQITTTSSNVAAFVDTAL